MNRQQQKKTHLQFLSRFSFFNIGATGFKPTLKVNKIIGQRKTKGQTFRQLLSIGSIGVDLGWTTLTSSLPHSKVDQSSTTMAWMKPAEAFTGQTF